MKKFKILAMALAALTVFSCSKDEAKNNGGTPPVVEGVETYATFNFNIEGATPADPKTKAVGDTGTDANKNTEAIESAVKNVRVVIFNDADKCEMDLRMNAPTTGDIKTTPQKVTSGAKKIFILANSDASIIPLFTVGTSTLQDLYGKLMYLTTDGTEPTAAKAFTADRITGGPYDAGTPNGGFFMSNERTADVAKVLVPGITADQSSKGGPAQNHFTFTVKRGVSKANVKLANIADALVVNTVATDGTKTKVGQISAVNVTFRNINKALRPVQLFNLENILPTEVAAATPIAAYFNTFDGFSVGPIGATPNLTNLAEKENFYKYYDRSFNFDQPLATTAPSKYVYISENTNNKQVIGNTTYLAVQAVYSPVKVITKCTYNPAGDGEFVTEDGNYTAGANFSKINLAGLDHIGGSNVAFQLKNNLFVDATLATSILEGVLAANNYKKSGNTAEAAAFAAEFKKRFSTYTGGKSYYRLNVGQTLADGTTNYGIRRNAQYQITVNSFKQLGVATPDELDDNPEIPVSSQGTYVTATIEVATWETKLQNGDL